MDFRSVSALAQQQPSIPGLLAMLRGGDVQGGGGGGGVPQSVSSTMAASNAMGGDGGRGAAQAHPQALAQAGGLGAGWQSDPELNNGAPYRQITSPEDQNWSDLQGRPIHMGEPAPAYQSGTTQGGFNSIFDRRAPTDGGFFTMKDYLKGNPDPDAARTYGWSPGSDNFLSTNNWRLLGNDPDQFMINGQVINRRLLQYMFTPQSVMADEGVNPPGMNPAGPPGSGIWARRMGSYGGTMGYPGNSSWPVVATPTY